MVPDSHMHMNHDILGVILEICEDAPAIRMLLVVPKALASYRFHCILLVDVPLQCMCMTLISQWLPCNYCNTETMTPPKCSHLLCGREEKYGASG